MKVIGIGPSKFFRERWNMVDTFMVVMGLVFFFIESEHNSLNLIILFRFFRLAGFIRIILLT